MSQKLIATDQIEIEAPLEKVWQVLTHTKYIKQWDDLPEGFDEASLKKGSIIEWEGYSKMTVVEYDPKRCLKLSLYLPKVKLKPADYDVSYTYKLSTEDDLTILDIEIGDFSPLPEAQVYYETSVEFAETAAEKIKELAEE